MATAAEVLAPLARRLDAQLAPLGGRPFAVRFWDGSELPPPHGPACGTIAVRSPEGLAQILRRPDQLGLSRAWVAGEVELVGTDLDEVLAVRHRFDRLRLGRTERWAALRAAARLDALRPGGPPRAEARLRGGRHSEARDRDAVRHHYDVSNRFYRMVLGPSMVYSCAYFASPEESVDVAQERKLELICRKLALEPGERFLDVGCGWGSLVIHAAREHGVRAVGATLSEPQAELARERAREAGVADRVEIRVAHYRELDDGPYDKVASVGMYEHVGAERLGEYMACVGRLVRPGGLFLNHGITRHDAHPWDPDTFIARYVFPDGELHPVARVVAHMEDAGFEVRDVESLREHYGFTLRAWLANLAEHREEAIAEAGADRERIWRLYMTGSALGFEEGELALHQVLGAARGAPHPLPLIREDLLRGSTRRAYGGAAAAP